MHESASADSLGGARDGSTRKGGGERAGEKRSGSELSIDKGRGKRASQNTEEHVQKSVRIVSVNVHTLALVQRTEGSGVTEGPRALRKGWNTYLESLLDMMKVTNGDGTKSTSLFILASTQLRDQNKIGIVKTVIAAPPHGYQCEDTHGVPGTRSRKKSQELCCAGTRTRFVHDTTYWHDQRGADGSAAQAGRSKGTRTTYAIRNSRSERVSEIARLRLHRRLYATKRWRRERTRNTRAKRRDIACVRENTKGSPRNCYQEERYYWRETSTQNQEQRCRCEEAEKGAQRHQLM